MKLRYFYLFFTLALSITYESMSMNVIRLSFYPQTITQWHNESRLLPPEKKSPRPMISPDTFRKYLNAYITLQKTFLDTESWINHKPKLSDSDLMQSLPIKPFALKYAVDVGSHIIFCGDLHGDVRSLSSILYKLYQEKIIDDYFKIIDQRYHIFFLGDLVDRGEHGIDTLTLVLMFALKNPGRVIILRGNHEDIALNEHFQASGFVAQLQELYTDSPEDFDAIKSRIISFYNLLPVVAFVGYNDNYFQCCHAGLEMRYNPQLLMSFPLHICLENITHLRMPPELWNAKNRLLSCRNLNINEKCLHYQSWFTDLTPAMMQPYQLGFLWNDFKAKGDPITNNTQQTSYTAGRGLMIGQTLAEKVLAFYSKNSIAVRGVIRGHQHNDSMPGLFESGNVGVYSLWNNKILTTIGTGFYGLLPAYIELTLQDNFDEWMLMSNNLLPSGRWQAKRALLKDWKNFL